MNDSEDIPHFPSWVKAGSFVEEFDFPNGFYFVRNDEGSVSIKEVLVHDGRKAVARPGRNLLTPIGACTGALFMGPIDLPPSDCFPQTIPASGPFLIPPKQHVFHHGTPAQISPQDQSLIISMQQLRWSLS